MLEGQGSLEYFTHGVRSGIPPLNQCRRVPTPAKLSKAKSDLEVQSCFLWLVSPVFFFSFKTNGHVLFFSMFLVTRPRSSWLKTKKKKTEVHKIRAVERRYHARNTCTLHLHTRLTGRRNFFTVCEEEEKELSPSPSSEGRR